MTQFHGAWPALLTPHAGDGGVNVAALKQLTSHLLNQDVDGLYLCGSTEEGIFMSVTDRKQVVETVAEQVNGRVPLIVHIGSMVLSDATELALHARSAGANGISSIIPPNYNDLASTQTYFRAIAEAVPDLPLLPYLASISMQLS